MPGLRRSVESGLRKMAGATDLSGTVAIVTEPRTTTVDLAAKAMEIVTPAISQFVIFLFTLLMYVATRKEIRQAAVLMAPGRERRLSIIRSLNEAQSKLAEYLFTVAAITAILGVIVAGLFWALGVPGAMMWGFLAFVLNFMPVVGPLAVKALLVVFGIATYPNPLQAMAPFAVFLAISLTEANVVTPRIVGDRITMNPMLVFLSVVLWTWLWGFAGAFLAMPLLALASVLRAEYLEEKAPKLPG